MTFLRTLPTILSMLILAAHFIRFGSLAMTILCTLLPALLLLRRPWARWLAQGVLVLGAILWIITALELTMLRQTAGQPWIRMAVILAAVASFNLLAAWLLRGVRMDAWFAPPKRRGEPHH